MPADGAGVPFQAEFTGLQPYDLALLPLHNEVYWTEGVAETSVAIQRPLPDPAAAFSEPSA